MTEREALKLAREALLDLKDDCSGCEFEWSNDYPLQAKALQAIDKVLAQQCVCGEPNSSGTHRTDGPCLAPQPEQEPTRSEKMRDAGITRRPKGWDKESDEPEPVAWMDEETKTIFWHNTHETDDYHGFKRTTLLYTTPPQRTWVGLTPDEIRGISLASGESLFSAIMFTHDKLKEKNT